jgi:hypothetical protein
MYFVGSLARFGGYRNNTSVSTPRAPGWVTFFATAARPRNIHLDRALGGCQHERNINGRAGRGPVSIFLTNRRESLHQQQSPAPWHSCSRGRASFSTVLANKREDPWESRTSSLMEPIGALARQAGYANSLKDMVGPCGLEPQTSTVSKNCPFSVWQFIFIDARFFK